MGIPLEVTGWDNATSIQDFTSFIYRKTRVNLNNCQPQGKILYTTVKSEKDANDVLRATGMRFAGQTLSIKRTSNTTTQSRPNSNNGNKPPPGTMISIIKGIMTSRYNPQTKMLDLTNIINEPNIQQAGFTKTAAMTSKFFLAMLTLAKNENLDIESCNLSMNNLDNRTSWIHDLAVEYPNLKNLALGNNNISKADNFNNCKNKFTMLRELILQGNPICQDAQALNKIVEMFPKLIIIDQTQVRDEQKLNSIFNFPVISKVEFFENDDLKNTSQNFIKSFLQCWDGNRMDLMGLYTPQSQFSFQADTTSVSDSTSINTSLNSWNNYTPNSRNLKKISQEKSRMQRLSIGQELISKAFMALPATNHNTDLSIETMMLPSMGGMIITIHGSFEEKAQPQIQVEKRRQKPTLEKRSFDRTWVIVPGGPSGLLIVSDMLMVRSFCANQCWSNNPPQSSTPLPMTPLNTNTPVGTPSPSVGPAMNNALPPQPPAAAAAGGARTPMQNELAMRVQKETNLKPEFVVMLLEQSNWDYETAGRNFMANRASIPPDAFQI